MTIIWSSAPQGSDEWKAARRGVITGSRAKDALDRLADKPEKVNAKTGEITPAQRGAPSAKAIGYAMDLAREIVGGTVPEVFVNAAMRTGTEQEPLARAAYEDLTGELVEEVGFACTEDFKFGASVDGLVQPKGMVEIKTMVSSATLFKAMVDRDISEYIDQINFSLWLLGLEWCDLCLWAPDLPTGQLTVIRVERDEAAIEALEADLLAFDKMVQALAAMLRARMGEAAPAAPTLAPTSPPQAPAPAEVAEAAF